MARMVHSATAALSALLLLGSPLPAQEIPPPGPQPHPRDRATSAPVPAPAGPAGETPSDEMDRGKAMLERETVAPPQLTSAEAQPLIGRPVALPDGQTVGQMADFVLGGPDGRIVEAVVSIGGVMGMGGRLVSVPAQSLRFHPAERMVVLTMSRAQFEAAPEFHYGGSTQTLTGPKTSPRS